MSGKARSASSSVSSERSRSGGLFGFGLFNRGRKKSQPATGPPDVIEDAARRPPAPVVTVSAPVSTVKPVKYTTPMAKNLNMSPLTTTPLTRTAQTPFSQTNDGLLRDAKPSWLCRTKAFQGACKTAFEAIDLDGSGTVDEKELYSGLLLIHLKLGTYAGPAACRPLSRERCKEFFDKMDRDRSGTLDQMSSTK